MRLELPLPEMETQGLIQGSKGGWVGNIARVHPSHDQGSRTPTQGRMRTMKKFFAVVMSVAMVAAFSPVAQAQSTCPVEVAQAKDMLSKKGGTARSTDIQAPRSLAG